MADFNLKDDLLGFGRSQLKYMLFHNTTLADLTDFTYKKGLFFYDTDNDSLEVLHDDTDKWRTILNIVSLNDPLYSSNDGLSGRVLVGTSAYGTVSGYNPVTAGFLKTDIDGILSNQRYITFEDIEPTDYTTVISAPGVDTRFATEKAIVDYVATQAVTPQDNILDWNGTAYAPYPTLTQNGVFSRGTGYITTTDRLNYGGYLFANQFAISRTSNNWAYHDTGSISSSNNYRVFWLHSLADSIELYGYSNQSFSGFNYRTIPIHIGAYPTHSGVFTNSEYITIDDFNQLFNINMTTVRLNKGTANKYLYLDASKNITYVDAPSGGVTPVDNILDWDTDAYKPYTSKTASTFYTGVTTPDAVAMILNYDGVFRATQLFEGTSRVMTTHGNWTANGSLHAVTTSSHAGFCPQLPASATGLFLRDDGTWSSILWKRVGTVVSPLTSGDRVEATVTGGDSAFRGFSASGITGFFSSTNNFGLEANVNIASTNSVWYALSVSRNTTGTAAAGIGTGISFQIELSNTSTVSQAAFASVLTNAVSATATSDFIWSLRNNGSAVTEVMRLTGAGELIVANGKLTGLATYADNAAATGGGLTAGQLYRTATGVVMVTY